MTVRVIITNRVGEDPEYEFNGQIQLENNPPSKGDYVVITKDMVANGFLRLSAGEKEAYLKLFDEDEAQFEVMWRTFNVYTDQYTLTLTNAYPCKEYIAGSSLY